MAVWIAAWSTARDPVANRLEGLQEPDESVRVQTLQSTVVDLRDQLVERRRETVDRLRERSDLRIVGGG